MTDAPRSCLSSFGSNIYLKVPPHGPGVKNSPSNAGDAGSKPSWGTKIPQVSGQGSLCTAVKTQHGWNYKENQAKNEWLYEPTFQHSPLACDWLPLFSRSLVQTRLLISDLQGRMRFESLWWKSWSPAPYLLEFKTALQIQTVGAWSKPWNLPPDVDGLTLASNSLWICPGREGGEILGPCFSLTS